MVGSIAHCVTFKEFNLHIQKLLSCLLGPDLFCLDLPYINEQHFSTTSVSACAVYGILVELHSQINPSTSKW